jgi:hypothetical protein
MRVWERSDFRPGLWGTKPSALADLRWVLGIRAPVGKGGPTAGGTYRARPDGLSRAVSSQQQVRCAAGNSVEELSTADSIALANDA